MFSISSVKDAGSLKDERSARPGRTQLLSFVVADNL